MSNFRMPEHEAEGVMRIAGTHRAVLILDLAGRIMAVNRHCLIMCGYRRDELIGQPLQLLLDPTEKSPGRVGVMLDACAGKELSVRGLGQVSRLGRRFRVDARLCPIRDAQGTICLNAIFMQEWTAGDTAAVPSEPCRPAGVEVRNVTPSQYGWDAASDLPQAWDCAAGYGRMIRRLGR